MFESERKYPLLEAFKLANPDFDEVPSPATRNRWAIQGARSPSGVRVRLEAIRRGAKWYTSVEAIHRFIAAMNARPEPSPLPRTRTPAQRERAALAAEAALIAAGA